MILIYLCGVEGLTHGSRHGMQYIVVSDIVASDIVVSDIVVSDIVVIDIVVSDIVVSDIVVSDIVVSDIVVSDIVVSDIVIYTSELGDKTLLLTFNFIKLNFDILFFFKLDLFT